MRRLIAIASIVFSIGCAEAMDTADTPASTSYPDPICVRPAPPGEADSENDQTRIAQYNLRVRRYNQNIVAYNSCMRAYVDKANADIKLIEENANRDIARIRDTANGSIKQIEGKIRGAVEAGNSPADGAATRSTRLGEIK